MSFRETTFYSCNKHVDESFFCINYAVASLIADDFLYKWDIRTKSKITKEINRTSMFLDVK